MTQGTDLEMNDTPKKKNAEKATYRPPQVIRVIALRPEEAVLGHCKVSGVAGPASASCRGGITPCRSQGCNNEILNRYQERLGYPHLLANSPRETEQATPSATRLALRMGGH